jgi:eukaryotic-like serine/threonine-protein kinase
LIAIEDACKPNAQKGERVRRTTVLLGVACAVAVAVAAVLAAEHERAAAAVAALCAVLTFAGNVGQDRLTSRLERQSAREEQTAKATFQPGGRLPKVRQLNDPIAIGVRAAREHDGNRVPTYVPRDCDASLRDSLGRRGFTLVVGDATAGKTRSAYEAVRAVLPGHVLIAPSTAQDAATAVITAREERQCVLWLDDLMTFLGSDGITRKDIAELLAGEDHHRLVVATMRPGDESRLSGGPAGNDAELMRIGRSVVDQVTCRIDLDRLPSEAELAQARAIAARDPRIEEALRHYPAHGIGEYLACGPQLFHLWQDGWTRGEHPTAAALVAVAVDCRRAGFTRPLPRVLLDELYGRYLDDRGGIELRPETLEQAWEWALEPRESGSALLRRVAGEEQYDVFGYLIDEFARRHPAESAPELTAQAALKWAVGGDAASIGVTARRLRRYQLAEQAFTREYEQLKPGDPEVLAVRNDLAATRHLQGRLDDAERDYRAILTDLARVGRRNDPDYLYVRGNLAVALFGRERLLDAAAEYQAVEDALENSADAGSEFRWRNRANLTWVTYELGGLKDPEEAFRALVADVTRALGATSPSTLASQGYLKAVLDRPE